MTSENQRVREFHHRVLELNGGSWFHFEPHLAAFYRSLLQPGAVAVDGGANMGVHTFQMARAVMPNGLIIAIEPVPEMLETLNSHLHRYHLPEALIRLVPLGLFGSAGEADFYQVLHPIQHEMSGLRNRHVFEGQQVKQIRVELTTLDAVCENLTRLDFVKLDLEGAEMEALRGGRLTLERFRPVVAIEQDQHSPQYFGYTWGDLIEYFSSMQYEVYDLFGMRYTEAAMFDQCAVWDFVGLPHEHPNKQLLFDAVRHSMELSGIKFDSGAPSLDHPRRSSAMELIPSPLTCACVLDYIGAVRDPLVQGSVHVPGDKPISFSGWAVDEHSQSAAAGVEIVIDGVAYCAVYGLYRADVADHFTNIACLNSGFQLVLPAGTLSRGQHLASLRTISHDQRSYYQGPALEFAVE